MWRRHMPTDVIVHSDRGSQYCSRVYQKLLKKHDLICSMSAKGNCYDNACAESFFHSLKVEAIHGERTSCARRMKIAETMHLNFASAFATLNRNRSACFLRPSP